MSIIHGRAHTSQESQYQIERSLRFNSADSSFLSRTPSVAGNRTTWTWSGWVKRSNIGNLTQDIFNGNASTSGNPIFTGIRFIDDNIYIQDVSTPSYNIWWSTSAVYRDLSAWYHIVVKYDTTQALSSNAVTLWVNGIQQLITLTTSTGAYVQNRESYVNRTNIHNIGAALQTSGTGTINHFSGYLTEINFIDGQALTPSSFGETDPTTGVWRPKKYTGSYGTNGFYLNFKDNSAATATTLGKDYSGNGNNWTPNAFTVIAGVNNDSMVDTPTPYGTDTGLGGEVRGNYATLNPLDYGFSSTVYITVEISNGNLDFRGANVGCAATFGLTTGKWYWEIRLNDPHSSPYYGAFSLTSGRVNKYIPYTGFPIGTGILCYNGVDDGGLWNNGAKVFSYNTFAASDIIGFAFDADAKTLSIYRNNVKIGSTLSVPENAIYPSFFQNGTDVDTSSSIINFGQRPFAYQAPSGFKALCTTNLPTPTVVKGSSSFNTVTYTGNSSSQAITGVGHRPDLVWIKKRNTATVSNHRLFNSISGGSLALSTDTNSAESANTNAISFGNDGFTLGTGNTLFNESPNTYVAWTWKGGGTAVANTQGTITSTVSANTTSGFSIVTYTAPSSGTGTIGHGLGVEPKMIITKNRNGSIGWNVYHKSIGNTNYVMLNSTINATTLVTIWNSTTPTSTVFSIGTAFENTGTYVAYCFAEIPGFSAFGSYTGNGSTDGPFVYTGFRPRYVLVKRTDTAGFNWNILDSTRDQFNIAKNYLSANTSNQENIDGTIEWFDILSNGFKIRNLNNYVNANGGTYIYSAFAETPFKYSLAR